MTITMRDFYNLERASRDTVDFKKVYVDMADDVLAGLLLSQIVFWFCPDEQGRNKLRVKKRGIYWLAKSRKEWFDEVRLKPRQVDRALQILVKKKLVITHIFKFNGSPTTHIRINDAEFLKAYGEKLQLGDLNPELASVITDSLYPNPQSVTSITENTTENTSLFYLSHSAQGKSLSSFDENSEESNNAFLDRTWDFIECPPSEEEREFIIKKRPFLTVDDVFNLHMRAHRTIEKQEKAIYSRADYIAFLINLAQTYNRNRKAPIQGASL